MRVANEDGYASKKGPTWAIWTMPASHSAVPADMAVLIVDCVIVRKPLDGEI
jgi:hypothetical protein